MMLATLIDRAFTRLFDSPERTRAGDRRRKKRERKDACINQS
jgi:hypothetical protein